MLVFKVIILGDSMVGKTAAVARFVEGHFTKTKRTIGVDFLVKNVTVDTKKNKEIYLQIWDFSGEEKFKSALGYYLDRTQGVLYFFDSTRPETLTNLTQWIHVVSEFVPPTTPTVVVSTKHDLEPKFDQNYLDEFMKSHGIRHYLKTSAKSGEGIKEIFGKIAALVLESEGISTSKA